MARQPTTEDAICIDVRKLDRSGILEPEGHGVVRFPANNPDPYTVEVTYLGGKIELKYFIFEEAKPTEQRQKINVSFTQCNYGGFRRWLRCPDCVQRTALLYLVDSYFACRGCLKIPYRSQTETDRYRRMRKVRKLREKLDGPIDLSMPVHRKPKGMHWKTYDRLLEEERATNRPLQEEMDRLLQELKMKL